MLCCAVLDLGKLKEHMPAGYDIVTNLPPRAIA